jgi:hypothetical protein
MQRRREFLAERSDQPYRQAQLELAQRKQNLLEHQFAASEDDRGRKNQALKNLGRYDMSNINEAPASDLATIDEGSVKALIAAHAAKYRVDNSPSTKAEKLPTSEVQVMREIEKQKKEMEQQLGRPVDYSETPMHQLIMAKAGKTISPEKMKADLVKQLIKDPIFQMRATRDPEATANEVDNLMREFFPEKMEGGDTTQVMGVQPQAGDTLRNALERFKARNKNAQQ